MSEETKPEFMPEPALWTKKQTKALINCSMSTLGNLLKTGQLVKRKIGRKTMIVRTSAEAFIRKDHKTGEEGRKLRARKPR